MTIRKFWRLLSVWPTGHIINSNLWMRLHVKKMIRNEFGGVNESFYNLYAITGDERHRWLAQFFYHNEVIDPLKELRDDLGTKHTNTFIPKVIAEARNYELTEDENSRKLSDFFWHTMIDHHTFAPRMQ